MRPLRNILGTTLAAALLWVCPAALAQPTNITLSANACYKVGDTVTVLVSKGSSAVAASGGQFFVAYDATKLNYIGGDPGDGMPGNPYTFEVLDVPTATPGSPSSSGSVDYAVGVTPGGPSGTTAAAVMARLNFRAVAPVCAGAGLVTFRSHTPPSRLTDSGGQDIPSATTDISSLTIDSTPPVITCPSNQNVPEDNFTLHTAVVNPGTATATDNCPAPVVPVGVRSDALALNAPYPLGTTTIHWTATDCSGNSASCDQTITVVLLGTCCTGPVCNVTTQANCASAVWLAMDYACSPNNRCIAHITLGTTTPCVKVGDTLVVLVSKGTSAIPAAGGQFFISYDNTKLNYIGGDPGDGTLGDPYNFEVLDVPTATPGSPSSSGIIDYAVGVSPGGPGLPTTTPQIMARLNFRAVAPVCAGAGLVTFRSHTPPSRLTDSGGQDIPSATTDISSLTIDSTPPVITCPSNQNVPEDNFTLHTAVVNPGAATATDNCPAPVVPVGVRSDALALNAPYPLGTTTIHWTATDCSGNSASCDQTITVVLLGTCCTGPVCNVTTQANCASAVWLAMDYACSPNNRCIAHITLGTTTPCVKVGDTLVVLVSKGTSAIPAAGGQFFISYDNTKLNYIGGDPGDGTLGDPYNFEVLDVPTATPGSPSSSGIIDYAVGVSPGGPGLPTTTPQIMARLNFRAVAPICSTPNLVVFRSHTPPSRLTDSGGQDIPSSTTDLVTNISIDSTPPVITCPSNQTVPEDNFALHTATINPGTPTVTDNCTPTPSIVVTSVRSDGQMLSAPYPLGTTTIHWTATDCSGNSASCDQTITVVLLGTCCTGPVCNVTTQANCASAVWLAMDYACSPNNRCIAHITLGTTTPCVKVGDTLVVLVSKGTSAIPAAGGQFFISYDNTKLNYIGGDPGDGTLGDPYNFEVLDVPTATPGSPSSSGIIDYAVGVSPGGPGLPTTTPQIMARLNFRAVAPICSTPNLVVFRSHTPPSRLTDSGGQDIPSSTTDLVTNISIDSTPPVIMCPMNQVIPDNGLCTANINPGTATATDNCTPTANIAILGVRSDGFALNAPYPSGVTTIHWTATDCSGNVASCDQTITVLGASNLAVTVQLANVNPTPFNRCITFDLYRTINCPNPATTVQAVLTFIGGQATANIAIPCGTYTGITARDRLHTLRRTADASHFTPSGSSYIAQFIDSSVSHAPNAAGNDALLGGNLNDDQFVDILDFGAFAGQFMAQANYGTPNTSCSTVGPHADINGDAVASVNDFTFISINFLSAREPDPCGAGLTAAPVVDISVFDLVDLPGGGWEMARVADFNRDGRVNADDIAYFGVHGAPRCPADFNGDGVVSVQDLFTYISNWFAGYPGADFNDDQHVSLQDLFSFLNAWFPGCP